MDDADKSSVRFLTIGDPHIRLESLPRSEVAIERILKYAKSKNLDFIVVMGDTLDKFRNVDTEVHTMATSFISSLSEICHVYLIIGNHDYPNNSVFLSKTHAFSGFYKWTNVTVVDEVVKRQIKGENFTFCPYVATGRFIEALESSEDEIFHWTESRVIFGHSEIYGCKMGGILSTAGDKWEEKNPFVIMGHCHDHHYPQSNVAFVGAMIQQSAGDNDKKTISFWKLKRNNQEYPRERRHDLKVSPYQVFKLDIEDAYDWEPPSIDRREVIGAMKIILSGTREEHASFRKSNNMDKWRKMGYRVVQKIIDDDEEIIMSLNDKIISYEEKVISTINEHKNKKRLKKLFLEISQEV